MKSRIRFFKKRPVFVYVYNCLNDSVKALLIAWNSKASALYLCFTLRPAIFNSLRPVTVGSGRVEPTCETSVNHVFLKENLSLSKSTAKEEVCTVGLFEDRL